MPLERVCLSLKGCAGCQPLASPAVRGSFLTAHPRTVWSPADVSSVCSEAWGSACNSASVLHRHRGHGASWHRPEEDKVLPQRRIPVLLSATHLDQACKLPDITTSQEEGAQSQWEVGGTTRCPTGGGPTSTALHELASSLLPLGHGLICATGIYREVEKRKETTQVSCVFDLREFLLASRQDVGCSPGWGYKFPPYL